MMLSFSLLGTLINPEPKLYAVSPEEEAKPDERLGKIQKRDEIPQDEIQDRETTEIQSIYEDLRKYKPEDESGKRQEEEVSPFK